MSTKQAAVLVHGVGPAEDEHVIQSFLEGQGEELAEIESGKLSLNGEIYPQAKLIDGTKLIESSWSKFRPVQKTRFSLFFETLALLWGMLQLSRQKSFSVGSEVRTKSFLGNLYTLLFLSFLFWCIHPSIISMFYYTADYIALTTWFLALTIVVSLLSRYDKVFLLGFVWIVVSLAGCIWASYNDKHVETLIRFATQLYVFGQGSTLFVGFLSMIMQLISDRSKSTQVKAARLSLVFLPFFAASGVGAIVWTFAMARSFTAYQIEFGEWAQIYSSTIWYPVFNGEMYNALGMMIVGLLLILPAGWTFAKHSRRNSEISAFATRTVFSKSLYVSGVLVMVLMVLFIPIMLIFPENIFFGSSSEVQDASEVGEMVFMSYGLWSSRILPYLALFFGALAIGLKIVGDIVFYLLPPSDSIRARERAVQKLHSIVAKLLEDGNKVLIVSHSQGTMIALDAVHEFSAKGIAPKGLGLWISGSPSVALYKEFLELNRLKGSLPRHFRNIYRYDDLIAGSIKREFANEDALDERQIGAGGHTNYWKTFDLKDIRQAFTEIESPR